MVELIFNEVKGMQFQLYIDILISWFVKFFNLINNLYWQEIERKKLKWLQSYQNKNLNFPTHMTGLFCHFN